MTHAIHTTFDVYQEFTNTTATYPKEKAFEYLTLGLCGESGEVAEKMKKIIRDGGSIEDKKSEIIKELGDVLWYVAQMAGQLNVSLSHVAAVNHAKLSSRKDRGVLHGNGDNR